jgi:hypothetical protein
MGPEQLCTGFVEWLEPLGLPKRKDFMAEETPLQNETGGKTPKKSKSRKKKAGKKKAQPTRRGRTARPYPAKTLEEALVIPNAIRTQNNGNPLDTEDVAQAALGVSRTTSSSILPQPHAITASPSELAIRRRSNLPL